MTGKKATKSCYLLKESLMRLDLCPEVLKLRRILLKIMEPTRHCPNAELRVKKRLHSLLLSSVKKQRIQATKRLTRSLIKM